MDNVRKKIKMLNLYRCSSEEMEMTENDVKYFSMDYFDGIKVEDINVKEGDEIPTLGTCMGIKADANRKKGISHQRYCLVSEEDFKDRREYPLLTIIQIFINPNLYQASEFADTCEGDKDKRISCRNCMCRVKEHIEKTMRGRSQHETIEFEVYRLLTEGDFAVLVWSKNVHDAYDISTLVRNISISNSLNNPTFTDSALFSYSITGVWNQDNQNPKIDINWNAYLDLKDKVAVRFQYSPEFRTAGMENDEQLIKEFLGTGHRLFGRYDHQILLKPQQFQELYPYIAAYKLGVEPDKWQDTDEIQNDVVKVTASMMKKGYISYINEKLLLGYSDDPCLGKEASSVWVVKIQKPWKELRKNNEEMIQEGRKLWKRVKERLDAYYQSYRNMQEYVRLIGRFYRVLNEMNQLMELRISTANLLKQMNVMLNSLLNYLDFTEGYEWDRQIVAAYIGGYLKQGIYAVEIFMRYVRNINLQTMQTPNYDLQTNVCVEKVLLAYSQMLRPLTEKIHDGEKAGLYLGRTLYPIVVPSMATKDLTVGVLFDNLHLNNNENQSDDKLMVVSTPTFLFMCDTCFMIPAVFHEIGHQYRYEARGKRNLCLIRTIYKNLIVGVALRLINQEYAFQDEVEFQDLVNDMCSYLEEKLGIQLKEQFDLRFLEEYMKSVIVRITDSEKELQNARSLEENIEDYIDETKEYVMEFDKTLLTVLGGLTSKTAEYTALKKELRKDIEEELKTGTSRENKQGVQKIEKLYKIVIQNMEKYYSCQAQQINRECGKILEDEFQSEDENVICLKELKELLENNPENSDLRSIVQIAVDLQTRYEHYMQQNEQFKREWENADEGILNDISREAYEEMKDFLERFQEKQKKQASEGVIGIPESEVEYARKRVCLKKEKLIRETISDYFREFPKERLTTLITTTIDLYREITADLFMCTAMKFTVWGYLIFIAETHVFEAGIEMELYRRIFAVVQCYLAKEKSHVPDDEEYCRYLNGIVQEQVESLWEHLHSKGVVGKYYKISGIESALNFMSEEKENVENDGDLTATQKWIFRVYYQAVAILFNVYEIRVSSDVSLEQDMWKDISGKESFLYKEKEMESLIKKTSISSLSEAIAQILNCPVKFFDQRKELLDEEIEFVFDNYEENCRNVFR